MHVALVYPHQLYANHPALKDVNCIVLIEDPLFFKQFRFHSQKLILHRATMQTFAANLRKNGRKVKIVESNELNDSSDIARILVEMQARSVRFIDPCDDWLSQRINQGMARYSIKVELLDDPNFLTPRAEFREVNSRQDDSLYFSSFYVAQRKRLGILLDEHGKPLGGKWSFDRLNRKRLPRQTAVPQVDRPRASPVISEAKRYVRRLFPDALGDDGNFQYPVAHDSSAVWLKRFLNERLPFFGDYEDAISTEQDILFHSLLTPMLNIGLLTPQQVINAALEHRDRVPLNSLEGFVRQVIGWREFVRLVYVTRGRRQRTRNYWGFTQLMPPAFYDGTTGIDPVDTVIKRVLRTGYCHHIERLMVLGNFMLLCEIHPDAVYRWFMEMFVDSYDWVMVPNVYGMSQYADGGLMTTKPYISGSSYILRMSDYKRGPWCELWDALYWRYIDKHADFFAHNPRTAVMVMMRDRMKAKIKDHRRKAELFLDRLFGKAETKLTLSSTSPRRSFSQRESGNE
jgi:deoxyribodipyrimidine photolyase-related protein